MRGSHRLQGVEVETRLRAVREEPAQQVGDHVLLRVEQVCGPRLAWESVLESVEVPAIPQPILDHKSILNSCLLHYLARSRGQGGGLRRAAGRRGAERRRRAERPLWYGMELRVVRAVTVGVKERGGARRPLWDGVGPRVTLPCPGRPLPASPLWGGPRVVGATPGLPPRWPWRIRNTGEREKKTGREPKGSASGTPFANRNGRRRRRRRRSIFPIDDALGRVEQLLSRAAFDHRDAHRPQAVGFGNAGQQRGQALARGRVETARCLILQH